jgi:hypothetical protein
MNIAILLLHVSTGTKRSEGGSLTPRLEYVFCLFLPFAVFEKLASNCLVSFFTPEGVTDSDTKRRFRFWGVSVFFTVVVFDRGD